MVVELEEVVLELMRTGRRLKVVLNRGVVTMSLLTLSLREIRAICNMYLGTT